ncbi:MAG: 4'-phosphopantetheinyl transferase superfamily protein, partial [Ginsengibacter sp.]
NRQMIYIFYCTSRGELDGKSFSYFLEKLPKKSQLQVVRFKKWEDRQRSLFSKLLLINGLRIMGMDSLSIDELKFTRFKRPYFNNNIDFNISHSGDYIICAISRRHKIGVDIEEVKEIPFDDFENEFSFKEMTAIMNSDNNMNSFYTLWTQKEAFLKAIGTGLHTQLNKVEVDDRIIKWNNTSWFLSEIILDAKYISHLCTDTLHPEIIIQEINFKKD